MSPPAVGAQELAPAPADAPLVVFAHGLEDGWASWRGVAAALAPAMRTVALDLPWRAGNDYCWRGRRPGQWLSDALDLVDGPPDLLVAHSFGAYAALELMCSGDDRAGRAVMLVCPFYRRPDQRFSWEMLDRSRITFVANIAEGVRARLGRRAAAIDPDVLYTMIDVAVQRAGPTGFLCVIDQFVASGNLPLHRIGQPTLVVSGAADPILSPRTAHVLAAAIPGACEHAEAEFDHYCHIRRPDGVAARAAAFVADISTGEPR